MISFVFWSMGVAVKLEFGLWGEGRRSLDGLLSLVAIALDHRIRIVYDHNLKSLFFLTGKFGKKIRGGKKIEIEN